MITGKVTEKSTVIKGGVIKPEEWKSLPPKQRIEVILGMVDVTTEGGSVSKFNQLLDFFNLSNTPGSEFVLIEVSLRMVDTVIKRGRLDRLAWFKELWACFVSKLPDEGRIKVICAVANAAIKIEDFPLFNYCRSDAGLSDKQRKEAIHNTVDTAIAEKDFPKFNKLWKSFGSELPIAVLSNAVDVTIQKGYFLWFKEFLKNEFDSKLPPDERITAIVKAIDATIERNDFSLFKEFLKNEFDSELPPDKRITAIDKAIDATIKKNDFSSFNDLWDSFYSELPIDEKRIEKRRTAIYNAILADIRKNSWYDAEGFAIHRESPLQFYEWWKSFGPELPADKRIVVILSMVEFAIKEGSFSCFYELWESFGCELPAEQCIVPICKAMDAAIQRLYLNRFEELWKRFGSKLPPEQRIISICTAMDTAVVNNKDFHKFEKLWERFGSELPAEKRIALICKTMDAAIQRLDLNRFEELWERFSSELSPKQRIISICTAMDITVNNEDFRRFEKLWESFGSKLPVEKRIVLILRMADVATMRSHFSSFKKLLERCELFSSDGLIEQLETRELVYDLLKSCSPGRSSSKNFNDLKIRKLPIFLSWADEQFKKVIEAHKLKTVEQACKAETKAFTEVKSISSALDQLTRTYEDALSALSNQEELQLKIMDVDKSFGSLYCTVNHAYQTFTSLYATALHQIDGDME
jgi:hypothetical protein